MASEFERHTTATAPANAGLDSLLERYHQRFEGGETIERAEIEASYPEQAAEVWRHVQAWKAVAKYLPSAKVEGDAREARRPAIQFQSLEGGAPWLDSSQDAEELARRIAERGAAIRRYEVVDEIARGAMGAILRVTDLDLGRELAMKVRLVPGADSEEGTPADHSTAASARFVEEARLTAVLEHPGIPPVHDFGVDDLGNFYFTMPWVRGQTLREVFTAVRSGAAEWSLPRALSLLLQVSDALAYAHAQGVIHRDLKPRNVMVGEFGEAYVMDWGLARDMKRADLVDLRVDVDAEGEQGASDSPITTRDGVVIGTPCYMSPEQARGDVDAIGPQTDVYALGAILYELLCGHPPYAPTGSKTPAHRIVSLVRTGPPAAVISQCPGVPAELAAICSRAMAREVTERYPDVGALGSELRAFLEGRVVASYAVGPWAELKKWTLRNRGVATLAGVLLLVLILGTLALFGTERERRRVVERELAFDVARELLATHGDLGAVNDGGLERRRLWLERAEALAAELPRYEEALVHLEAGHVADSRTPLRPDGEVGAELARLEFRRETWLEKQASARSVLASEAGVVADEEIERHRRESTIRTAALDVLVAQRAEVEWARARQRPWGLEDPRSDRMHRRLHGLVWDLRELARPEVGPIARVRSTVEGWADAATRLEREHADDWTRALASIQDSEECPLYEGVELEPVLGLVPLGRNAAGLWEFWHPFSGERPPQDESGRLVMRPETGLVFVLVPGGAQPVGVQTEDPEGANYCDPDELKRYGYADDDLGVRSPQLRPYFLSKFELTQAQWHRLTGASPSRYFAGSDFGGAEMSSPTCPVERVRWEEARALGDWGLALPTEAQLEVAGRSGSQTAYWWGDEWPPPTGTANYYDSSLAAGQKQGKASQLGDDGAALPVPVDTFRPNPWGFHHISGNVAEWCRDAFAANCYEAESVPETGELLPEYWSSRAYRGGGFNSAKLPVAHRRSLSADASHESIGVRPVFEGLR